MAARNEHNPVTNRLSFWVAVATAIPCVVAICLAGFSPSLLLTTLLGALHVPAILATLLLARATWRALRGRPWALRVGAREVLAGTGGFVAPILFLLAWNAARETGVIDASMFVTSSGNNRSTDTSAWRSEAPAPTLQHSGLAVTAPAGALGEAFAKHLRGDWSAADSSRLYGDVTLTCEPPFARWPLYKSAELTCRVEARLQLRTDHAPDATRGSTIAMEVIGTWTMIGLASAREFHEWLGRDLGKFTREAIDKSVRNAK